MKKFTVHLMHPYLTWEHIEANGPDNAIKRCIAPDCYDPSCDQGHSVPQSWLATEEEKEDV